MNIDIINSVPSMDHLTNFQLFILAVTTPVSTIAFLIWAVLKRSMALFVCVISIGFWLYNAWEIPEIHALKSYIYVGVILLFLGALRVHKRVI